MFWGFQTKFWIHYGIYHNDSYHLIAFRCQVLFEHFAGINLCKSHHNPMREKFISLLIVQIRMEAGAHFGSTNTKIGTIQRRLVWPLCKDDMQIGEPFHIFTNWKSSIETFTLLYVNLDSQWKFAGWGRDSDPVLCDSSEVWDGGGRLWGGGSRGRGHVYTYPRADSWWFMAATNTILYSNYLPVKKKKNGGRGKSSNLPEGKLSKLSNLLSRDELRIPS